jgi:hypothetical protein
MILISTTVQGMSGLVLEARPATEWFRSHTDKARIGFTNARLVENYLVKWCNSKNMSLPCQLIWGSVSTNHVGLRALWVIRKRDKRTWAALSHDQLCSFQSVTERKLTLSRHCGHILKSFVNKCVPPCVKIKVGENFTFCGRGPCTSFGFNAFLRT